MREIKFQDWESLKEAGPGIYSGRRSYEEKKDLDLSLGGEDE